VPGFPIRKSSDLSSVDSSPRHIAASHVLHRLLMPRHPPYALNNLHHKRSKMLASTIQFSNTNQEKSTHSRTPTTHHSGRRFALSRSLRFAIQKQQRVLSQDPTVCRTSKPAFLAGSSWSRKKLNNHSTVLQRPWLSPPAPRIWGALCGYGDRVLLLRKEVIQPHLPVRLPCYDFVPIASPTFDHSLPCGLGHGLRVLPTFVT
jgi:hypothetical protein